MFYRLISTALSGLVLLVLAANASAFKGMDGTSIFASLRDPNPAIVGQVFAWVESKYVDADRADPVEMLEGGFRALESQYAEVIIDFDSDEGVANISVVDEKMKLEEKTPVDFRKSARLMRKTLGFVAEELGEGEEEEVKNIYYAGLNGAVSVLDPHSSVFSPTHFDEFQISTRGSFGGIGFVFSVRDGDMVIITPINDTPASRAGLRSGDKILFIDGEPTINMPTNTAANKMRGNPGTKVTLTLAREGWIEPRAITFVREKIHVQSVESHLLEKKGESPVLYVKVKNFQKDTTQQLTQVVDEAVKQSGGLAGLILDFRNNPGGLLEQAINLSDGLMEEGTIVSTRGGRGEEGARWVAKPGSPVSDLPAVVLINQGSASASEIVAAALRSNRALLIGNTTFGKGSVQKLFPLKDGGALKLTVSQYLTPGDVSIQSIGIQPDILLYPATVKKGWARIGKTVSHANEADLEKAFNEWGNADEKIWRSLQYWQPPENGEEDHGERRKSFEELSGKEKIARLLEDFNVSLGLDILQRHEKLTSTGGIRKKLFAAAEEALDKAAEEERAKIVEAFSAMGIDWVEGGATVEKLTVIFPERSDFVAGVESDFTIKVRNDGAKTVRRLWGRTDCDNPLFSSLDFPFGELEPGETGVWSTRIKVPRGATARWDTLKFDLFDGDDVALITKEYGLSLKPVAKSFFAYDLVLDEENEESNSLSGNGRFEIGDVVKFDMKVENIGGAKTPLVEANIRGDGKDNLYLESARHRLEEFEPGEKRDAPMLFRYKKPGKDGLITVIATLFDRENNVFFSDEIKIDPSEPYTKSQRREQPEFKLAVMPPLRTSAKTLKLNLTVTDDRKVKDFFAHLGNKKITYAKNDGEGPNLPVKLNVKLEPGQNMLTLTGRDDQGIIGSRTFFINKVKNGEELAWNGPEDK